MKDPSYQIILHRGRGGLTIKWNGPNTALIYTINVLVHIELHCQRFAKILGLHNEYQSILSDFIQHYVYNCIF